MRPDYDHDPFDDEYWEKHEKKNTKRCTSEDKQGGGKLVTFLYALGGTAIILLFLWLCISLLGLF